jgi:glycogen operon protein
MFVAGDEMGRTQKGNNNAYCQDNEINWQNWHRTEWQDDILDFTAYLIRLRQAHKVFQRSGYLRGEPQDFVHVPDIAWLRADATRFEMSDWESFDTRSIGMYLGGGVTNRKKEYDVVDNAFYWFLNSSDKPVDVTLPSDSFGLKYQLMFNTEDERDWEQQDEIDAGSVVTLAPWSSALWMVTLLAIATPQQ